MAILITPTVTALALHERGGSARCGQKWTRGGLLKITKFLRTSFIDDPFRNFYRLVKHALNLMTMMTIVLICL